MANIAKRPDGRWRARYRDASGAEHSRHFARKVDAQNWLDGVTTSVTTGTQVDPRLSKITVGEWAPRWLATKVNLKQSTRVTYEILLHKHILPTWADARLSSVTHEGVAAWVASLEASGLSASSIRQTHRVLALLLGLAVRDGRLARNPAAGVALPRTVRAEQVYLTHGQVDRLASAAGEYRVAVLFLAYTGVRFGEMAARCASATSTCYGAAMPGHKSATMTLDLYGHLFADQLDEVADAMSAARALARDHADFCGLTAPMSTDSAEKTRAGPNDSGPCVSAPGRTRTCNLLIRSQVLYPLSYGRKLASVYRVLPGHLTTPTTGPRRLRDSNPGWALDPNRISSAAP